MSADPIAMVATDIDNVGEPTEPQAPAWRLMDCRGCGQRPSDLTALDAIALTAVLRRRCELLLAHPTDSPRHTPNPASRSALEPVAQVSAALAAADSCLRSMLGEETLVAVSAVTEAPGSAAASLGGNIRRLIATIGGATTHDWYRPRPNNGPTAGEVVWLALHEATHRIEDAEFALDSALATNPTAQRGARELPPRLTLL